MQMLMRSIGLFFLVCSFSLCGNDLPKGVTFVEELGWLSLYNVTDIKGVLAHCPSEVLQKTQSIEIRGSLTAKKSHYTITQDQFPDSLKNLLLFNISGTKVIFLDHLILRKIMARGSSVFCWGNKLRPGGLDMLLTTAAERDITVKTERPVGDAAYGD